MLPLLWILAGLFGVFVLLSKGRTISEPKTALIGDRAINASFKLHRLASVAFSAGFFAFYSEHAGLSLLAVSVALCGLGVNAAKQWRKIERARLSADRRLAFRETLGTAELHFLNLLRGV